MIPHVGLLLDLLSNLDTSIQPFASHTLASRRQQGCNLNKGCTSLFAVSHRRRAWRRPAVDYMHEMVTKRAVGFSANQLRQVVELQLQNQGTIINQPCEES